MRHFQAHTTHFFQISDNIWKIVRDTHITVKAVCGICCFRVGYKGTHCESLIDACQYKPSICLNGGLCKNTNSTSKKYGFVCLCPQDEQLISGIQVMRFCRLLCRKCWFIKIFCIFTESMSVHYCVGVLLFISKWNFKI